MLPSRDDIGRGEEPKRAPNEEVKRVGRDAKSQLHPALERVSVKVPPFWRPNPEIWFSQMESQFVLAGITTEITTFHHVVSALQPEELGIVGDILLNLPAVKPYAALRARLCSQYAESEEQRLRGLISGMQLGDRKPSRLLLEMRSLADSRILEELLKSLFLQRLPTHVQQILAISNDQLDKLAEMADGIMAVANPTPSVHVIDAEKQDLQTMLLEISSRLSRLETRERYLSGTRKTFPLPINQQRIWSSYPLLVPQGFQGACYKAQETMFLPDGKLEQPPLDPPSGGPMVINRLYLSDKLSRMKYLIDTGADVSVIPLLTASKHLPPVSLQMFAANGTVISTYGADFLRHYGLLGDILHGCLEDSLSKLQTQGTVQQGNNSGIKVVNGNTKFHRLLAEFPSLVEAISAPRKLKHEVKHTILTRGSPIFFQATTTASGQAKGRQAGVSVSCGHWNLKLNEATISDRYPVPHIQDCLQVLDKKRIFSTLDLAKAYQQIPVQEEDIPKTAVTTPFGLFEFLYIPFGLSNAAATFQRFIHHVLRGMDFCVPYSDDVLVASEDEDQHLSHLKQVFQRFEEYGVVLNASKSVFEETLVKCLGDVVTAEGISPLPEKVAAITNFSKPETVKELRRFLAICNFYWRFVPHAARTQAVLNNYLKGAKRNDRTPILWSEESAAAFEKCKKDLADATLLHHPWADASLAIVVDASDTAVGVALHQQTFKGWQPLVFFSKTLSPAQWRYSAYDRELLAAYMAIKYFQHMVEGRSFTLFTDHKPLVYAFKQQEDKCTPRQLRHLDLIGQFTTDIRYLKGSENVVADALSRIHI
ncbi:retrovirus-related Pol polyprotein from transposon 17.6 [Trichonephila clavipes]|nr:retrovirus-related Pol polyprotein from transposon 17.6 [Trichonephila clavipes]